MKRYLVVIGLLLFLYSCDKEKETVLVLQENYGHFDWEKEGLIKGNLYSSGFDVPMFSNLICNSSGKIELRDILSGTYRFEYYIKPLGPEGKYSSIPKDTVFQVHDKETNVFMIK
jgi:hypothetical protein